MCAEDWYISNAGGMALEPAFSRFALRGKYALSIGSASFSDLPERLRRYYDSSYRIELRSLYEDGVLSRRQWTFRDTVELTRLSAAFDDDNSGFIELYNADKLISESHQISAGGSDYITYYYYNRGFLIRAETRLFTPFSPEPELAGEGGETAVSGERAVPVEPAPAVPARVETDGIETVPVPRAVNFPDTTAKTENEGTEETLWIDYYRYTRSYALRGVERQYLSSPEEGQETVFIRFPQLILGVGSEQEFVKPGSVFSSEFFDDVIINSGDRILYTTDDRGRILSEIRRDENDNILGEVINTWSGDRLASVLWKSDEGERLIEYEYNSEGDRIFERNLRNGVLERAVSREDEREVEELYINDAVVLRAVWEDGRKISEELIRPSSAGREE
ncbi:MAG: hypothetical protein LBB68_11430 [Treponema sp.]|nr:hypothetical protein [Treponema sp.]